MSELVFDYVMRLVVGIVLGGVLGSFITMLTFRLPRGKSLLKPPSTCPSCRKKIAWRDLVPLYSYWQLKGKCRNCGAAIGEQYIKIEAASVAALTLILLCYGFSAEAFMVTVIFLIVFSIGIIVYQQGRSN